LKISENFKLSEFIDKETYQKYGTKSLWFIDKRIVNIAQFIRSRHKMAVTINNWSSGGSYSLSGFRPPQATIGAKMSQHRYGRAIDVKISGMTPQELYQDILANERLYMKVGLTTIENIEATPTWNHLDIRETDIDHILVVDP